MMRPMMSMADDAIDNLFSAPPKLVNVGLESFAEELTAQGVEVVQVDWSPPARGDTRLADLLYKLSW